jgi:cobalt-zinc-cadmium efflux system protein
LTNRAKKARASVLAFFVKERALPDACDHVHLCAPTADAFLGRRFLIAVLLNAAFVVAELIGGTIAHSLALIADAGHNFGDVVGLVVSWGAWWLAKKPSTSRYTYGLRSATIMAAFINVVFLLIATGMIAWEALQRLGGATPVEGALVAWVATGGILINGVTALLFGHGRDDLNIRAAFLHLAGDAVVSLGVVVAGIAVMLTGWLPIDPIVSLAIAVVIAWTAWGVLRDSVHLALHAVPASVDYEKTRAYLVGLPGVRDVHDLHIWGLSTTATALSAHLVMNGAHPGDAFLAGVDNDLRAHYGIDHATLQIEIGDGALSCAACDCPVGRNP